MDSPPARSLARSAATVFPLWLLALIPGEARAADLNDAYTTYGIHNDAHQSLCQHAGCVYPRGDKDPSDPGYPAYWTSRWTMYRVFKGYETSQPPYLGPPPGLNEGEDYQASSGVTYYDSTWKGASGEGAMEEHYEGWCLPIFPISNKYSCSFISLGDFAFFVTYDDRPKWMPKVCLFSQRNHPPGRDFIKHLPYSESDSARRGSKVQAYGFWVSATDGRVTQVGVSPDRTAQGDIFFGYAFDPIATPDGVDRQAPPYRHPQSFYFSGVPRTPDMPVPDAPMVSQNYLDFAMVKPDPAQTWGQVAGLDPATLPECRLFDPPPEAVGNETAMPAGLKARSHAPGWGWIGRSR